MPTDNPTTQREDEEHEHQSDEGGLEVEIEPEDDRAPQRNDESSNLFDAEDPYEDAEELDLDDLSAMEGPDA